MQTPPPGAVPRFASLTLLALGLATAVAFLVLLDHDPLLPRVLLKPVPVLCLAAWVGLAGRRGLQRLVLLGLVASAAGDVVLLLPGDGAFVGGLVCFLLAHLIYVAAFVADERRLRPLRAIPFLLFAGGTFAFLASDLGSMVAPVALYCLAIAAMGWRAAARVGASPATPAVPVIGIVGASLFLISDAMIAVDTFHAPIPHGGYAIMVTYYLGQLGIAYSAARG